MKRVFIYGFLVALLLELPLWYDHCREVTFYQVQAQELRYLNGNRDIALPWCLSNPNCNFLAWIIWEAYISELIKQVQEVKYVQVDYMTKASNFYFGD